MIRSTTLYFSIELLVELQNRGDKQIVGCIDADWVGNLLIDSLLLNVVVVCSVKVANGCGNL